MKPPLPMAVTMKFRGFTTSRWVLGVELAINMWNALWHHLEPAVWVKPCLNQQISSDIMSFLAWNHSNSADIIHFFWVKPWWNHGETMGVSPCLTHWNPQLCDFFAAGGLRGGGAVRPADGLRGEGRSRARKRRVPLDPPGFHGGLVDDDDDDDQHTFIADR